MTRSRHRPVLWLLALTALLTAPLPAQQAPQEEDTPALPAAMESGPIAAALREGRYEDALARVEEQLQQRGELAAELYARGLAQMKLAERRRDEALLKDAGLNFMRVVAYFPRSGYGAPALIEAGYIHTRLGRPGIARRLYGEARQALNAEREAAYAERLRRLEAELPRED